MNEDIITLMCEREHGVQVVMELSADADADMLVETFKNFMLALGYSPETVKDYFPEESWTDERINELEEGL